MTPKKGMGSLSPRDFRNLYLFNRAFVTHDLVRYQSSKIIILSLFIEDALDKCIASYLAAPRGAGVADYSLIQQLHAGVRHMPLRSTTLF